MAADAFKGEAGCLGWQSLNGQGGMTPPEGAVAAFTSLTHLEREIQQLSLQLIPQPTPQAVQLWPAPISLSLGQENLVLCLLHNGHALHSNWQKPSLVRAVAVESL